MFKKNVGSVDRALRVIAGIVLIALFFVMNDQPWRYWLLIGVVPLLTGLMSSCPLYSVFGLSTCPLKKS